MRLRFFSAAVVAATSLLIVDQCAAIRLESEDNRQLEYGRILTLAQDVHAKAEKDDKKDCKTKNPENTCKGTTAIYEPAKM